MPLKIIFVHEYGAPEHHKALTHLAHENGIVLERREFGVARQFARGLRRLRWRELLKAFVNGFWLLSTWFGNVRGQRVVIGIAPFDWRLLLLLPLIGNNTVYWNTSWPYWSGYDGDRYPFKIQNRIVRKLWSTFIRFKLSGIFFVTEHALRSFQRSFGTDIPATVVYHSYDPVRYFPGSHLPTNEIVVGFAGRLEKSKGVEDFISIFKQLSGERFKFLVAGEGSMKSEVQRVATDSAGRLVFAGFLQPRELGEHYRSMDFLLVPSRRTADWEEAFGMVIIEAMACGVIPIVTDHPGPVEILTGNLAQLVFSEAGFRNEAVVILRRAMNDPDYMKQLKTEAVRLSDTYSVDAIAEKWSSLLAPER